MQDNRKRRELRKLAGVVALGTGFLGLAGPAVGAVTPAVPPALPAAAASVAPSDLDAVRRSGNAQAILEYIAKHPDQVSYRSLLMTLPKSVAREVHAGLATALAKAASEKVKPDEKAAKLYKEPDGHLPAGSQYEYELDDEDNGDINPGYRGGHLGGY